MIIVMKLKMLVQIYVLDMKIMYNIILIQLLIVLMMKQLLINVNNYQILQLQQIVYLLIIVLQ